MSLLIIALFSLDKNILLLKLVDYNFNIAIIFPQYFVVSDFNIAGDRNGDKVKKEVPDVMKTDRN